MNASLFVLLFVLLFFLDLVFFLGGAGGWGWVCFLGVGGPGIQCNARLTQSIALRSAIVGRENSIAGGLFVLFCLFVLFFCVFYFIFIIFSGEGLGYRLSQLCSAHCITENFSDISFLVCFALCCGLVCLVCLFVFFKTLQYFGAPENIKK